MKKTVLIAAAALAAAPTAASAQVYDFADFGNAAFAYGYGFTGFTFTDQAKFGATFADGCRGQSGFACTTPFDQFSFPIIGVNTTASALNFETVTLPTGTLFLHPDSNAAGGGDAILAFTAPTAGDYKFTGTFSRLDNTSNGNGVDVIFGRPGTVFSTRTIPAGAFGTGFSFAERYTLNAGQTIFLGVNNRGEYSFDSTGLTGAVAYVPEPATWAMMIGGFGAVGSAMRRRRKVRTAVSFA